MIIASSPFKAAVVAICTLSNVLPPPEGAIINMVSPGVAPPLVTMSMKSTPSGMRMSLHMIGISASNGSIKTTFERADLATVLFSSTKLSRMFLLVSSP